MNRALLSKPVYPVETYEQDLADMNTPIARGEDGGQGSRFIGFFLFAAIVLALMVLLGWIAGRIDWGVGV